MILIIIIFLIVAVGVVYFIMNLSSQNTTTTMMPTTMNPRTTTMSTTTMKMPTTMNPRTTTMMMPTTMPPTTMRLRTNTIRPTNLPINMMPTTIIPTTMMPTTMMPTNIIPRTWNVIWNAPTGSINFYVGDRQVLHFNIRSDLTVINTWDGSRWGAEIRIERFHTEPRPLNFTISFDIAQGFTITHNGTILAILPNRFNLSNVNDLIMEVTSGITVSEAKIRTSSTGISRPIEKLNKTNCVWGRIPSPGASGSDYKYLGNYDTIEQCATNPNIDERVKAITLHGNNSGGYSRQCYSINDNNTQVPNQDDTVCGIIR